MESDIYKKKELDKLTSNLTELLELILAELQQEIPEKEFTLTTIKANLYWSVQWKSTKLWKSERYLKESFQLKMYPDNEKWSLRGYHRVEDFFEQLEDTHFLHKEKSLRDFLTISNALREQIKYAIIKSVHQEFDPNY